MTNKVVSIKDAIRARTIGAASKARTKTIEFQGVEVAFKQPNLSVQRQLISKAKGADGELDGVLFLVWSVIYCTFTPDLTERVFDEADFEVLMEQQLGGFLTAFSKEVGEVFAEVDADPKLA